MNRLRRLLPPVSSLVVFEAAGRLNNFTAAAQELNVTQAAVSRQILGLEAHLGVPLFHRQHRQVRLTAEGITLHQAVSQGLLSIVDCVQRLTAVQNRAAISIGATRICHTNGAIAATDGPFKELIDFSITSGTIGSRTSAKLADDFSQFLGAIDADCDHLFAELYRNWYFAFCLAENCGAVQLS